MISIRTAELIEVTQQRDEDYSQLNEKNQFDKNLHPITYILELYLETKSYDDYKTLKDKNRGL